MADPAYKTCIHCGTPFSPRGRDDARFCCNGCAYVYHLIQKEGLDHYYQLRDRQIRPVQSRAFQPRDLSWLETLAAEAEERDSGTPELVLDLEGISCVGCVWIIEKLFRQYPGAVRIDINTQYGQVRLQWRKGLFPVLDFAREIQQFGYLLGPAGERPQRESRRLVGRIGLCGAFAMNAMLFTLPRYLGMDPEFSLAGLFELLALLFATLSVFAGGSYFLKRGFSSLARGVLHIDFPIALGIVIAWCGSLLGWLIQDTRFLYFDFVAIFIFLMLVGRWFQERALEDNRNKLLSKNQAPRDVTLVDASLEESRRIPLEQLVEGQRLRILPGEVVPVLAELESKDASLSFEWINGESEMRHLREGQYVPSGAQNIGLEPLLLRARQSWREALLFQLLKDRPEEQRNRALEKILRTYIVIVIGLSLAGVLGWGLLKGDWLTGLQAALSVLVVSCPCAIGVAFPLAQEWAILQLRPHGIFTRSNRLFHALPGIRKLVLDKTGTLTLEAPEMRHPALLRSLPATDRAVLREMVRSSLHPVSRALREALLSQGLTEDALPERLSIREEVGYGLLASVSTAADSKGPDPSPESGDRWTLGRPGWRSATSGTADQGSGADCEFRHNGELVAAFHFEEALRDDARRTINTLSQQLAITILSGDRRGKVEAMALRLGLPAEAGIGEQSPQEKERFVSSLGGEETLFVGDGANDALAFDKAAVKGTPATPHGLLQEKADFYFTGRGLGGIIALFQVGELRRKALRRAFLFAVTYNVAVVVLALSALMHPLLAAILMPLSSVTTLSLVAWTYHLGAGKLQA